MGTRAFFLRGEWGEGLAFDTSTDLGVVEVSFIGMSREDALPCGAFLERGGTAFETCGTDRDTCGDSFLAFHERGGTAFEACGTDRDT